MGSPPQPPLPLHPSILSNQQDRDKPGQWGLLYVDDIKFPVSIDDTEFPVSRNYIDVVNNDHQSASFHRRPVAVPSPSRRHSVDLSQPFCRSLPAVLSTSPPLTILSSAGRICGKSTMQRSPTADASVKSRFSAFILAASAYRIPCRAALPQMRPPARR